MKKSVAIIGVTTVVLTAVLIITTGQGEPSPIDAPAIASSTIPLTTEEIVIEAAKRYGIDTEKFLTVAKCESSLRPRVVGDRGNSFGLFQIHLPSHPDVIKENALDPYWSSEWAAKKFKENPYIWTCYGKLFGQAPNAPHNGATSTTP